MWHYPFKGLKTKRDQRERGGKKGEVFEKGEPETRESTVHGKENRQEFTKSCYCETKGGPKYEICK